MKVNTLGVTYNKGEHRDTHYRKIVGDLLEVPDEEVCGFDTRGNTRFLFKLNSKQRYEYICKNFTDKDIVLDQNNIIRIDDISSYGTKIEVSRVPLEMDNDTLVRVFSAYGKVIKCNYYFRKYGDYENLTHSGERLIWMELSQQIPQSVHIKQMDNYVTVKYENQPFSCNKCGHQGHTRKYCKTESNEYKCIIDLDNINIDETDIHKGQPKEIFKCTECNYECFCEEILKKHTEEHTNHNILCSECGLQTSSMAEFVNHMKKHTEEKPYKCCKCGFSASSVLALEKHMKMHTGEKPCECSKCVQQPSKSLATSEHDHSDANKVMYKCDICDIVNSSKTAHDLHTMSHSDETLLQCTECDYECRNKDVLNNHCKSKHNIYSCTECDFKGKSEKHLEKHAKTHTLNKMTCTDCGYTCKSREDLAEHMKKHSDNQNGDKISYSETLKSPPKDSLNSKENSNKRELSLSPIENKTLRSNSNNKKSKNKT